jgi:hypothetical protein
VCLYTLRLLTDKMLQKERFLTLPDMPKPQCFCIAIFCSSKRMKIIKLKDYLVCSFFQNISDGVELV